MIAVRRKTAPFLHPLAAAVWLVLAAVSRAGVTTIYYDDFSGPGGTPLNGTVPDVSAARAAWQAGMYAYADGTYGDGVVRHMFTAALPFTPSNGTVYELSATVDNQEDWFAIGFLTAITDLDTRFSDNAPRLWGLVRPSGATNFDQAYLGPGTNGGLGNATTSSAATLTIRLDTTAATQWVVTWFFDSEQAFQQTVDPTAFTIRYVAMGANGYNIAATGKISSFKLVQIETADEASVPVPADNATDVSHDVVLQWTPGELATAHDVYFGTSLSDVNAASRSGGRGVLLALGQDANSFSPGRLQFGTAYYWRVDEVGTPPSSAIFTGAIWTFTVEPEDYPVQNVTATASSSAAGNGPENTVNGSGLDGNDLHSTATTAMWLTPQNPAQPVWIAYEFQRIYKLSRIWVWNCNPQFETSLGLGIKNAAIQYSLNGVDWTDLGSFVLAQAPGTSGYAHNTTIDFGGAAARYVRINATHNYGGTQWGLSEVRFFYIPVQAREPNPASGATGIAPDTILSWRAGREAAKHKVCLGTDPNALSLVGSADGPSYVPSGLTLATTYYWRVDEVNLAQSVTTWTGDVWSFRTSPYVVVDDMESYNDTTNKIFDVWIDGYNTSTNGSVVGLFIPVDGTYGSTMIFYAGRQSMPFAYNNTGSVTNAEATRTFSSVQDWTAYGVKTLTLHFYGQAGNTTTVPLYVRLADQNDKTAKVTFGAGAGENPLALADPEWTTWNIPLSGFAGVTLSKIRSMTIGLGKGTGSGLLYIDDIQLYPAITTAP